MSTELMPVGNAVCPKCNGTKRRPYPTQHDPSRMYAEITATYDKATDTLACDNCGGQTMSLTALGHTRIDPATGKGCLHEYRGCAIGNCYHQYTCTKCGDVYDIDSGG